MATQRVKSHGIPENGEPIQNTNGHSKPSQVTPEVQHGVMYYVFNRTIMPLFLILSCPNFVLLLYYTAVHCEGSFLLMANKMAALGPLDGWRQLWANVQWGDPVICSIIGGYALFALVLMIVLPGPTAYGPVTPKGNTPVYKDNGFFCYIVTLVAFCGATYIAKTSYGVSPTVLYDKFDVVLATLHIASIVFCGFLYIKGLFFPSTADCGSSGNPIFDYYWGTELYPRVFGLDVKVFTNCRFGMTVWPLLILVFGLKSYELHGFVDSMWVSVFLHMVYFTKFFWWEAGLV